MTIKTISLRTRKPDLVEKSLLQPLPSELEETTFDLARLLKNAGVWRALPKGQRRHLRRLRPRVVSVVRGKSHTPGAIRSPGPADAASEDTRRPKSSAIHSTKRKPHAP
ncbi:hypothetical protein [Rhizobium laguerreae]|uniref:hypothetical protein n=1 Tax=Rhizobium laguerreae TaxID=1076926 RepID=UPI001441833A|nr:hypothetical protein [Rhizobium laguerreae]NKN12271.1 hypothetical protein [Rhizobium laguerreae]